MKTFRHFFLAWCLPWVPKRLLSRFTGVLMRFPLGPLSRVFVPLFAWSFGIDAATAEHPLGHYRSLDAFFTRRLKPELRPLESDFVHPVDGRLTERGEIRAGELLQAKGWSYSLGELLGDEALAGEYEGGTFATYYLCPADYHRVHAPCAGRLVSARHIPGLLWPVNEWSVHNIRRLFCLNERVVLNFESEASSQAASNDERLGGKWSLVMVGATNVGHMTIALDPSVVTNRWMWHAPSERRYEPPIPVQPGSELGTFHLGSTVICLYQVRRTISGDIVKFNSRIFPEMVRRT